ncbi:polyphosphate kinase 2 family protein [Georgenia yuyongxinii]|uniref:Polyphosphate kinase 2 family protein n=1 Tax=Georgenia yuyongxinii TaxID=2589797 RepID=A0A5B8C1I2_9MICO|nr:polyphosphate kinase 2 family protein [Georgenia yuyongxinii]
MATDGWDTDPRELLRAGADFDLAALDRAATPGWAHGKRAAEAFQAERGELLSELQERLFAHGRTGGDHAVLLIVQGLDTAGKGGVVRHVLGMVDPQGVALRAFGVPTNEEHRHHYLWRVRKALPSPGLIGVFDRSHYEDVLVVRVDELVEESVWSKRFAEINRFERQIVASGTTVVKVALMVGHDEQGVRLMERLDRPDKRWKWNPGDVDTRRQWDAFQEAYTDVFARTSTDAAPWYVVPADKKWYARLAVTELLTQTLVDLDLDWPKPRWRVDTQRRRLAETMSEEALAAATESSEENVAKAAEAEKDFADAVARADALGVGADAFEAIDEAVRSSRDGVAAVPAEVPFVVGLDKTAQAGSGTDGGAATDEVGASGAPPKRRKKDGKKKDDKNKKHKDKKDKDKKPAQAGAAPPKGKNAAAPKGKNAAPPKGQKKTPKKK